MERIIGEKMKDSMIKIGMVYIDMDGVLANFFQKLAKLYGMHHWKDIPSEEDTVKRLSGTDFFNTLEPFPTTHQLLRDVHWLTEGNWSILSTPLKGDEQNSIYWKNRWLDRILDQVNEPLSIKGVQPLCRFYSHHKHQFAKEKRLLKDVPNLLIDDRPDNIKAFIQQGGVGLRYQADESNYKELITKLGKELY